MKKFFKLFGFAFITFLISFNVNAGVCDGANARDIVTVNPYNTTGWDAWAYVCKYTNCKEKFTDCSMGDFSAAKDWCKGTYQKPGYKNYNHTVSVGQCADSRVCTCTTCSATCTVTTTTYSTVSCTKGTTGCVCVSAKRLEINGDDIGGGSGGSSDTTTEVCTKTKSDVSTETYDLSVSYGGDSCSSDSDYSSLTTKAKADLTSTCSGYSGDNIKTTLSTPSCEKNYRVKYNVCDCAPNPYLVKNVREAQYTTKGDTGNSIAVYCINPADEPPGKSQVNTFDATQCVSSNSTPECGFANILIEGYYRSVIKGNGNYSYAVIGAAMRLWSAHVGNSGFKDTGIADEDDTTIDSENAWLHYVPGPNINGPYLNVFKATLEHYENNNGYRTVSSIYEVDTVTGGGISKLQTVACSKDRMGIFCSGDTGNYLYALSLYTNTVQGNKDMLQHLNEINFRNNPGVLDANNNDPVSYTTTILSETKVSISYKLRENVDIECSTLPDEIKNSNLCKVNQQAIVKDQNGNTLGTANITEYDYCKKNYCYVEIEFSPGTLNCNVIDKFVLKARVTKQCGANSVKSYYACSNPSEHQIMYSFEPDSKCGDDPTTIEEMESSFRCNLCEDDAVVNVKSCDSSSPVTNTVSDPSLNCILHKTSGSSSSISSKTAKGAYDYSDTFKVNTDICRVYCSDKVNYKVSGRKTVATSFQLSYDIERDLGLSRSGDNRLVSIIEMERDCVSEIFYNQPFDYVKDWSKAYGLGNVEIDNWKDLYNALAEKSKDENDRKELLNKLVYDLYNCNFYKDIVGATGGKIGIPLDSVNSYDIANDLLQKTRQYCYNNECVSGYLKYEGGAEFINPRNENELRVGSTENNPYLVSTVGSQTSSINIKYCKKDRCFRQIDGGYSKEDFSAAGSSQLSSSNVSVLDVKVPENDYAIFTVKFANNVYNPVRYQVQQGTGKVQVEVQADKDKYFTIEKNTFPVSSYAYNLCTKNGDGNSATCNVSHYYSIPVYSEFNGSVGAQQILFSRNIPNDNFIAKLKESSTYSCNYIVKGMGTNECPPNVDCAREGYIFRNIDLADPVPTQRNGTNWDKNSSSYVQGVINEIVDSVNPESPEKNLYATDYYLEYSFVLNPTSIEEIRSNNKNTSYFELPVSCKLINDSSSPLFQTYSDCKSVFLNDIRTSHKYSIIVNKADGISRYTEDKNRIGGGN